MIYINPLIGTKTFLSDFNKGSAVYITRDYLHIIRR